jgi:hypothetical protein
MARMSPVQQVSQRVVGAVTPHVPGAVKRPLKRAIPRRYWRYIDADWHRKAIGLPWDALGKLQFDFLVDQGLQPHHYLLDVGCGPLRGGVNFIRYLEPGRYFGVDRQQALLEAGRDVEIPRAGLAHKRPVLTVMENFDFERLGQEFDYALAQSVFTHLPLNKIVRCLMNVEKVLVAGGRFFATIYENERGKLNLDPVEQRPGLVSRFDADPFHYDFGTFEWICDGTSLRAEYLGDWNNPRNQKMLLFTKAR